MPPDHDRDIVSDQCAKFLEALDRPGFIILGWKKEDGTVEVVQSLQDMTPVEYFGGVSWAMHSASHKMDHTGDLAFDDGVDDDDELDDAEDEDPGVV
jgi:hypothetical protein